MISIASSKSRPDDALRARVARVRASARSCATRVEPRAAIRARRAHRCAMSSRNLRRAARNRRPSNRVAAPSSRIGVRDPRRRAGDARRARVAVARAIRALGAAPALADGATKSVVANDRRRRRRRRRRPGRGARTTARDAPRRAPTARGRARGRDTTGTARRRARRASGTARRTRGDAVERRSANRGTIARETGERGGAAPTIAEQLAGEIVYGTNPVLEALRQNRRALFALYVQTGEGGAATRDGKGGSADSEILRLAEARNVTVRRASKHDLNMACDNKPHQGVALDAEALEIPQLEDLPTWDGRGEPPVWLALDEIVDPQNLGAALRSAHFLGVDGVVCCAKNSAPFNATVSKASAGAMEAQVVHQTGVMHRFLAKARDEGWDVVGAAADARAEDVSDFSVRAPTILVMGNEGSGLRTNVRRACNRLVEIPRSPFAASGVDSLNVSVAAGILIHRLVAARRRPS